MEITPNRNVRLAVQMLGNQAKASPPSHGTDTAVFDRAEALKQTLHATPLVRPEMVARARQRIEDTQYPPKDILDRVALALATNLDNATDYRSQNQA